MLGVLTEQRFVLRLHKRLGRGVRDDDSARSPRASDASRRCAPARTASSSRVPRSRCRRAAAPRSRGRRGARGGASGRWHLGLQHVRSTTPSTCPVRGSMMGAAAQARAVNASAKCSLPCTKVGLRSAIAVPMPFVPTAGSAYTKPGARSTRSNCVPSDRSGTHRSRMSPRRSVSTSPTFVDARSSTNESSTGRAARTSTPS